MAATPSDKFNIITLSSQTSAMFKIRHKVCLDKNHHHPSLGQLVGIVSQQGEAGYNFDRKPLNIPAVDDLRLSQS